MSATLSFAELSAQHVELLPDRTVLSLMLTGWGGGGGKGNGNGGGGGAGGSAIVVNAGNLNNVGNVNVGGFQSINGNQTNVPVAVGGAGGAGGAGFNLCAIAAHACNNIRR